MENLVRAAMVVVMLSLFTGCTATRTITMGDGKLYDDTASISIIVVGGWNERDRALLESFGKGILGSIPVFPNRRLPLSTAAAELYRQITEDEEITGRIILVAGSWAGLPSRIIDAKNRGLVAGIITVGSPAGGYPSLVNSVLFGTGDEDSETPLYVIAGFDESLPKRFWMASRLNDGILDVEAVNDLGKRRVTDRKIFPNVKHLDLFKDPRVIQQVNSWAKEIMEKELAKREAVKALLAASK